MGKLLKRLTRGPEAGSGWPLIQGGCSVEYENWWFLFEIVKKMNFGKVMAAWKMKWLGHTSMVGAIPVWPPPYWYCGGHTGSKINQYGPAGSASRPGEYKVSTCALICGGKKVMKFHFVEIKSSY